MALLQASILINLESRRARSDYYKVKQACIDSGIEIKKVYEISRDTSLKSTVESIEKDSPKRLLIAAGDGTVSRTLSILADTDIEVGIIPLGTTNNFARSLGIPLTIEGSLKSFAKMPVRSTDLGRVGGRYFANITGIGISARVASSISDAQKKRWGRLAYAMVGLKCLLRHKAFYVTVTDRDGDLRLHFQTHQVVVANGKYHAGRKIAEDASVNSHELIVFPIGGKSKINFIFKMIDFYLGSRRSVKNSSYLIAKDIIIHTNHPQSSEVDGEVYEPTPLKFKVMAGVVKVRH